jgi:hypothetical protein
MVPGKTVVIVPSISIGCSALIETNEAERARSALVKTSQF